MKIYSLNLSILKQLYTTLVKIREFEKKIVELYPTRQICCPVHLCIGQEAIATGVCAHLKRNDYVFSHHRNHAHLIAKDANLTSLFAELLGKKGGCSQGKGGSMHMNAAENRAMGTTAMVAGGIPISVGTALASKIRNQKIVSVVFFGDGAVDEGTFFESLNFASLFRLPVIFVCENNFYAVNSPQKARQVNRDIYRIAKFFHMPGLRVNGNDVFDVWQSSKKLIERARQGNGPGLMEARTYRYCAHVGPLNDVRKGFREKKEWDAWIKKCPVRTFRDYLLGQAGIKPGVLRQIDHKIDDQIRLALEAATALPYPDNEDLAKDVY